jgi:hypothetical protein
MFNIFKNIFKKKENKNNVSFESQFIIKIIGNIIFLKDNKMEQYEMNLNEIKGIAIETNDKGPFEPDVIWHIFDGNNTIHIPSGANGEDLLLSKLQNIEGFNNQEMINAMSSVENKVFVLLNK